MRKVLYVLFVLCFVLKLGLVWSEERKVIAVPSLPEPRTFSLDLKESRVRWVGKGVTGAHFGTIQIRSGEVQTRGRTLTGGRFEIDMTTIAVEDLVDSKKNAKLTNHLKSDDFFSAGKYPTATFEVTQVKETKEGNFDVTGNLTIKGITQPITFPLKVEVIDRKARATGTATLDRTKWDIRYRSGQFFKGLGNKLIYDDFEISLDLAALLPSS